MTFFEDSDAKQERPLDRRTAAERQFHGHPIVDADGNAVLLGLGDLDAPFEAPEAPEAPESDDSDDATEAARELAEAEGLDLSEIEGTGSGGRVTKGDVEDALDARAEAAEAAAEWND